MLNVHLDNGRTERFDLTSEGDARRWIESARDSAYQRRIRAISVLHNGVQYALPRPQGFDPIFLFAEAVAPDPVRKIKGGERITAFAGEAGLTIMAHSGQRAVRVSLVRQGKQKFNPLTR